MRHLSERINNLSPAKRALLELKLREKAPLVSECISPRENRATAPLSINQESLWFLEQLNPNTSTYNLSDALRLRGYLQIEAVQQAVDIIVARHETLRTTFRTVEGEPQQFIADTLAINLQIIPLSKPSEAEVRQILTAQAERPFDLAHGPLVRFTLVKLREDEHVLLAQFHHIISDGWSVGVFWQEFVQVYEAVANGQAVALPSLPLQFGDYTTWLHARQIKELGAQLAFWKTQLADAPALLELPTDRPRPALQSFRGAQQIVYFSPQLRDELKAFSQREGVTLFMTLLAAFNALLTRYTGQEDLVVGAPLAGRTRTETESLIGFFVNTLVLRTNVAGDPTVRELLQRVRNTALDAYSHQDTPFEKLVAELRPERSLSYNPIFQTAFALQNESTSELKISGLQLSPVKLGSLTAKFDLFLSLCEVPEGLRATVEYSTDLFDATTIERLLQHYQNLLAGIVANPLRRISELPLLSDAERQQLLSEWNNTATDYPSDSCLHQLFEEQAERSPDAVAVVAGEVRLSYRELNQRANQVAHYLRTQNIQPDTPVAIFMDRSLLMVIGILGILKAGGAYLPLDPSYPKSRLQFMLADAQTPVLLTQQRMLSTLPETSAHVVCLDTDWAAIARHSESNPNNVTTSEHLAYVIYTSGSTGQPKGTAIVHRAVNRLVFNTNYVQLDATDCIAQVSNVSFDAATFELWGALLHGAKLVLIQKDIALSPVEFVTQLRRHKVTTMFVTTALFNALAREVPDAFSTLKTVMFGGEACDPNCVRDVLKNGAPQRLLHVYGPTESTTFASWHLIETVPEGATTIPIGRPLSNTTLYVLDRHLNPVPIGVHGELYVGGAGLAREYWRREELTAERFIQWPVAGEWWLDKAKTDHRPPTTDHQRLYKTGDIVRYLPDGSIEFIGRKDQQIKLRGFRIELGEIEAALLAHPAVQECVLLVTEGKQHDKRLIAYFVASAATTSTTNELREFLQQRLPDFMLPAVFCRLDELPLTPNGKVDRRNLPALEDVQPQFATDSARPTDELELRLAWIWEQVLGVQLIGAHDNFFALGGHSLLAVRLFTAIEKAFGQRLPLATLFQAPTIAELAAVLRQGGWQASWHSLVALRPNGTKPPFFCVHAVGGNVLEYHGLAQHLPADQPFYGLQSLGLDGNSAPLTSIAEMATAYLAELRQIQPTGPYYLSGRSFGGSVAYEMACQLHAQGETVGLLALLDTYPLGWLKMCAPEEAQRQAKEFFRLRVMHHLNNLRQLNFTDKLRYVWDKAQYKKRKYKNLVWKLRTQLGRTSAHTLRSALRNIEELNYCAVKQYVPQAYPGRVTFFCASEEVSAEENIAGWQMLAAAVDVVRIPGDHQTMIQSPHVEQLARQLTECLTRATEGKGL